MWQDQTIRVSEPGQLQVAADGDVHVTWTEDGTSFTLIVPMTEAVRLRDELDHRRAEMREGVPA